MTPPRCPDHFVRFLPGVVLAAMLFASGAAHAVPVVRTADLILDVSFPFIRDHVYPFAGNPSGVVRFASGVPVSVDETARSIALAAGAVTLGAPVTLPVTGNTAVASITVTRLSNAAGSFFIGGAAGFPGEPPCPAHPGEACVRQTGLGGQMGLVGTMNVHIVPDLLVIPVKLSQVGVGIGGSGDFGPFSSAFDGAPWTIGVGSVAALAVTPTELATTTEFATTAGSFSGSTLNLVSPTYLLTAAPGTAPLFSRLTIEFTDGLGLPGFAGDMVPEPSTWLLLGAALGAFAIAGRGRS